MNLNADSEKLRPLWGVVLFGYDGFPAAFIALAIGFVALAALTALWLFAIRGKQDEV